MVALGHADAGLLRIEICPNCSLSVRSAVLFFGSLCFVSFAVAGMLAVQGFWPILPFAGLEMLALGLGAEDQSRSAVFTARRSP